METPDQPIQPQQNFDPTTGRPLHTAPLPPTSPARRWVKWLVIWLAAWPLAFIIGVISHSVLSRPSALLNIVNLLIGLYGLLGWIPMVIAMTRENKS